MYAIGGSANPTINSQGNVFIASDDNSTKEVTMKLTIYVEFGLIDVSVYYLLYRWINFFDSRSRNVKSHLETTGGRTGTGDRTVICC